MRYFIITIILVVTLFDLQAQKLPFSLMEINHIKVETPELFSNCKQTTIHLDSITEAEYSFPLPNGKVISEYGARGSRQHTGVDIKTFAKDTIRSAFSGVVRMSKPYGAYGNVIVVRHSFGIETVYSHNFKNLVQSGDSVKSGQAIALTGATGRATTEHLHFETRINGHHFNPNIIFDMQNRVLRNECIDCIINEGNILVKPTKTN